MAQSVEQLIRNQQVGGSSPPSSSKSPPEAVGILLLRWLDRVLRAKAKKERESKFSTRFANRLRRNAKKRRINLKIKIKTKATKLNAKVAREFRGHSAQ